MSREVEEKEAVIVEHPDDLLQIFTQGSRPASQNLIGLEFERFVIDVDTGKAVPFRGGPRSIEHILKQFGQKMGWKEIYDQDALIALEHDGSAITLEPGGQLEISCKAFPGLKNTCKEILSQVKAFDEIAADVGVFYSRSGVPPVTQMRNAQWVPKTRYDYMKNFHQTDEAFLEMMTVTSSIQVNFDYSSEQDCAQKIRVSSILSPLLAALFANSFYENNELTGFKTRRMQIWNRLDPMRSGVRDFFVDGSFNFKQYRDYMMSVPMYFISREGQYKDVSHITFEEYLKTKPYGPVHMSDWILHLTTTFPEVRLKDHLEFRSIDSSTLTFVMAAGAFIKGLMYSQDALDQLEDMYQTIRANDIHQAIADVAVNGMQATLMGKTIKDQLPYVFEMAMHGLPKEEHVYLLPMKHFIDQGISPAEEKIRTLDFSDPQVWKNF